MKLTPSIKSALYWFIDAYATGKLRDERWDIKQHGAFDDGVLDWKRYQEVIADPFVMKVAITVWSNNLEVDEKGLVINEDWARFRAFQAIRHHFDKNFSTANIKPPLEQWEVMENEFDT
jgi:hypothetical protein